MFKSEKGFSLLESLFAVAILSILTIAFFLITSSGYNAVFFAGDKTEQLFEAQRKVNKEINSSSSSSEDLTIPFDDSALDPIKVEGYPIEEKGESEEKRDVILYHFQVEKAVTP
ncbi:MAG: type IV pilus modification PilV family protein [Bacillota bacterium]